VAGGGGGQWWRGRTARWWCFQAHNAQSDM